MHYYNAGYLKLRVMPIFKQLLAPLYRCQLCGVDRQQQHSLCNDCWRQLPWLKSHVQRQERQIQVACHYDYPIDRIIQKFKYEQQLHFQQLLAGSLIALRLPKVQAIVPMPISDARLAQRGYNQALVIANLVAQHLHLPIWQPILRQDLHAQKGLSRLERLQNIQQQFQIKHGIKARYRRVLIIDDVITTGSSIDALSQQLEQLGCQKIYAACIASAEH